MSAAARAGVLILGLAVLAVAPRWAPAEVFVWVDEQGVTHLTDDPAGVPEGVREEPHTEIDHLAGLWSDPRGTEPVGREDAGNAETRRIARLLRSAVEDLRRGETARAAQILESVLEREPGHPAAHFYLADLDRQRGRLDASEAHLRAFLAGAGEAYAAWREQARTRIRELERERTLAAGPPGPLRLARVEDRWFELLYDTNLETPGFARRVLGLLEDARRSAAARLGVEPREPTRVVVYGRAAYLEAWGSRFSFETVGFFDGRIHVASAAHPAGELRALLFHEYTHALYRERTATDRPFWLNEGLAELLERAARGLRGPSRSERAWLRARIADGAWIPLASLHRGFGGLRGDDARAAYLEAAVAARWIESRVGPRGLARLLDRLGAGVPADAALREVVGLDTAGIDAEARRAVRSEFAPASLSDR